MKNLLIISALAIVGSASAAQWVLTTAMSPINEVPPVTGSNAQGTFLASYDDITNQLVVNQMSVEDFVGTLTVSHIHVGAVGVAGPVTLNFGPASNWTPTGGGDYTYSPPGAFTFNEADEAALLSGGTYVNVHSTFAPGGEVRGNIVAQMVPEPGTMAAVALGLAALAKRRRQK